MFWVTYNSKPIQRFGSHTRALLDDIKPSVQDGDIPWNIASTCIILREAFRSRIIYFVFIPASGCQRQWSFIVGRQFFSGSRDRDIVWEKYGRFYRNNVDCCCRLPVNGFWKASIFYIFTEMYFSIILFFPVLIYLILNCLKAYIVWKCKQL